MRKIDDHMENIVVRIKSAHRKALDDYANELSNDSGENVTISELVRKSIKDFLKAVGRLPERKKL